MDLLSEMVVFAKVVELRSFSAAARQLGLSSSAVSKSMGRLEAHMGAKLLNRTTRSVTPTDLGHEAYAGCTLISHTAREVKAIAGRHASAPTGRLKLSAPVVFGQRWLCPRLPAFLARWPDLEVSVTLTDRIVDLVDEGFDIALRIASALQPALVARPLLETRYILVASPEYLRLHGEPQLPAQLAEHPCVLLGYGNFNGDVSLSDGQQEVQVQLRGRLTVDNSIGILSATEALMGIGLLPDFTAAAALANGEVVQLLPGWALGGAYGSRKVYAVYSPTRYVPRKVRAFIDHLTGTPGEPP